MEKKEPTEAEKKHTTDSPHWDKCLSIFNLPAEVIDGIAALRHDDGVIIADHLNEIRSLNNRLSEIRSIANRNVPQYGTVGIPEWMDGIKKSKALGE